MQVCVMMGNSISEMDSAWHGENEQACGMTARAGFNEYKTDGMGEFVV